jgi:hypothetical protein
MGLLDDAIREHLELKRRHGADPSEVERQEQEALGPARRGAAPAADAEPDETAGSVGTLDEDEARDALYDDELEYDDEEPDDDPDEPVPATPAAEPEAPVVPPVREPREPADQATVDDRPVPAEADLQDLEPPRAPDEPEAEDTAGRDVLEETPEFLEETPEHDRLWFEQKPPRDFEF